MSTQNQEKEPFNLNGFVQLTRTALRSELLGSEKSFRSLIAELLEDRENRNPTESRVKGLQLLSDWTVALVRYSAGENFS